MTELANQGSARLCCNLTVAGLGTGSYDFSSSVEAFEEF